MPLQMLERHDLIIAFRSPSRFNDEIFKFVLLGAPEEELKRAELKKKRSTHCDNSFLSKTGRSAADVPRGRENEKDCRSMSAFSGKSRGGISSEVGALLAFGRVTRWGVAAILI